MEAQPSKRIVVLLEMGAVGYLIGIVTWTLFWFARSFGYDRLWIDLGYLGSPLLALSLMLTGISSFAIGKLYDKWLATSTGSFYIFTAMLFFTTTVQHWLFFLFPGIEYLLALSLLLWAMTVWSITRRTLYSDLGTIISTMSLIAAVVLFLLFRVFLFWGQVFPIFFSLPHFISQILSAILLHKISSGQYLKP